MTLKFKGNAEQLELFSYDVFNLSFIFMKSFLIGKYVARLGHKQGYNLGT